jgi:hypothetical protein
VAGQIFLSYSSQDREYVVALVSYLEGQGLNVWYDPEIGPGDRYAKVIENAMTGSACLIVVMTPASNASPWVEREMENAERQGKKIFPLLLAGEPFFRFASVQWTDVRNGQLPPQKFVDALRAAANGPTGASPAKFPQPGPITARVAIPRAVPPLPAQPPVSGPPPAAPPPAYGPPPVHVVTYAPAPPARKRGGRIALVVIMLLLLGGAAGWWGLGHPGVVTGVNTAASLTQTYSSTVPVTTPPPPPLTTTPPPPPRTTSLDRKAPGCAETNPSVVIWATRTGKKDCTSTWTVLTKTDGNYAQLDLSLGDGPFPTSYMLSATIFGFYDPNANASDSHHACAGFEFRQTADYGTYDVAEVCGDGTYDVLNVANNVNVKRMGRNMMPNPGPIPRYKLSVRVYDRYFVATVTDVNNPSVTRQIQSEPTGYSSPTVRVGFAVYWENVGARAVFSDCSYQSLT